MYSNKLLSTVLILSATSFAFSQTEIPLQINSINGISAFDQSNNPLWTSSSSPFKFDNSGDLRTNPINSQTSIFDFELEFEVLAGTIPDIVVIKFYDMSNVNNPPPNNEPIELGYMYAPQTSFSVGDTCLVNFIDDVAGQFTVFIPPQNSFIPLAVWAYGEIITSSGTPSTLLNPPPSNADLRYFDVDIFVDPVDDLQFASSSPLTLNSSNEYELAFSWTASPDPIIDSNAPDVVIEKYKHFLSTFWEKDTQAPTTTETITFDAAPQGFKKINDFAVIAQDNYGNTSTSYNSCYAYDSFKKNSSGGTTPQLSSSAELNPDENGDLVFTGWFDVDGSMNVDSKNVLLGQDSKMTFVSGSSNLEIDNLVAQNNSVLAVDGGNLTVKSDQKIHLDYNNALLIENGTLTLDADFDFTDGSYILAYDNLIVKAGKTVTLNDGCNIKINSNTNITLETGASIVLEDGAFVEMEGSVSSSDFISFGITMNPSKTCYYKVNDFSEFKVDDTFWASHDFTFGINGRIAIEDNVLGFGATNKSFSSHTNGKWSGFHINNSTLTLEGCTIEDAKVGIMKVGSMNPSSPIIQIVSTEIKNCIFGIVGRANATNSIMVIDSEIHDNTYGVYSDLNGHISIEGLPTEIFNNSIGIYSGPRGNFTVLNSKIYNNSNYGVKLVASSYGFLGSNSKSGNNQIWNNGMYDIYNVKEDEAVEIFAQKNYWYNKNGLPLPPPCQESGVNCHKPNTVIYGCGPVISNPTLDCLGTGGGGGNTSLTQEQQDLALGFEYEIDENYALAETQFNTFLLTYPTSNSWAVALGGVVRNMEAQEKTSQVTAYLEGLILVELGEHRNNGKELLLIQYVKEERFGEASQISQELIATYSSTELELLALLEEDWLDSQSGGGMTKINGKSKLRTKYAGSPEAMLSGILSEDTEFLSLDEELAQLPNAFQLEQNFPNPFNPTTTISYLLKKNSNVKLSIYNLKGRLVKTLVNQTVQEGRHSVTWDGKDEFGRQVASSVYFYKLETANFSQTRKMLLLK